ncbi:MAG: hypothetical protein WD775_14985 [Burkholderiales bacterium]
MNADELRARQAPIKERYRADAESAAVTLRGQLDKLLQLTERYCVVYQTLRSAPPITIELKT